MTLDHKLSMLTIVFSLTLHLALASVYPIINRSFVFVFWHSKMFLHGMGKSLSNNQFFDYFKALLAAHSSLQALNDDLQNQVKELG